MARLIANKARGYASTTPIVTELHQGSLKVGGNVGAFQKVQAVRHGQPLTVVYPPTGLPASANTVAIIATTKRPNAAKMFVDWALSAAGQSLLSDIYGVWVPRPGATPPPGLPPLPSIKILLPTNRDDFALPAHRAEFQSVWNRVTGVS